MTTLVKRELFIHNLIVYMLNTVSGIKGANKETQKRWISEIRHNDHSEYLDPSFNKLYPGNTNDEGVDLSIVWDDVRKSDLWNAILILSDIDEVLWAHNEYFQHKVLIYLMNAFILKNSTEFKVFPN